MNTVTTFNKALNWIDKNSVPNAGIITNSQNPRPYPEVTGYYIPTLLDWNETERAIRFGKWLITCQHPEGCWGDPNKNEPYAFDTGQILKGLLALSDFNSDPIWNEPIRKACEWMVNLIQKDGEPRVPDVPGWGSAVPLGIILYAYEPILKAAKKFNQPQWSESVELSIQWFLKNPKLTDFTHLSHFHAYVLEALCDLGHANRAAEGMVWVEKLQKKNGSVPGFPNVRWICSTGLFQYAIVWYKLGKKKEADLAFDYAEKLQNKTGGWYGSYGFFKKYFPKAEISWANKYFLDALKFKLIANFEEQSTIFSEQISKEEGRYQFLKGFIQNKKPAKILDAGCGKGRYIRNFISDQVNAEFTAMDLSTKVMATIPGSVKTIQGSLLRIPFQNQTFDLVYTIEALEHAVHIDGALRELLRVVKPGGSLIIIDKDIKKLGVFKLPSWEQWFGSTELKSKLESMGTKCEVVENIPYEGKADGLFNAWIATKG